MNTPETPNDSQLIALAAETVAKLTDQLDGFGRKPDGTRPAMEQVLHDITLAALTAYYDETVKRSTFFLLNVSETAKSKQGQAFTDAGNPVRELVLGFASASHMQGHRIVLGFAIEEIDPASLPAIDPFDVIPSDYANPVAIDGWFAKVRNSIDAMPVGASVQAVGHGLANALEGFYNGNPRASLHAESELVHMVVVRFGEGQAFQIGLEMNLNAALTYANTEISHYRSSGKVGRVVRSDDRVH